MSAEQPPAGPSRPADRLAGARSFADSPPALLTQMIVCPLIVVGALVAAVLVDRWWIAMTAMFLIALLVLCVFVATVFDLLADGAGPLYGPLERERP